MTAKPTIFLCMPHYGGLHPRAALAFYEAGNSDKIDVLHTSAGSSLLAMTFNELWTRGLNLRGEHPITHFAMLHADIVPEPGWLDTLVGELQATGADLVSAVVPIRGVEGLTSTAIDSDGKPFEVERRLTMREVMQLPETFSAADCGFPDRALCVNSGCWVCKFTDPWIEEVAFTIRDTITREPDGTFRARVMSEDWDFSRQAHRAGLKVLATRKVKLQHMGQAAFGNDVPWGSYQVDHMAEGRPLPVFEDVRASA